MNKNSRPEDQICRALSKSEKNARQLKQLLREGKDNKNIEEIKRLTKSHECYIYDDIDLILESANLLREHEEVGLSLEIIEKAIASHGRKNILIHALAKSYLKCKYYKKAKGLLEHLLTQKYEEFAVWFDIGVCCCQMNEKEESLNAFNKCIIIKPSHTQTIINKITTLMDLNRIKEARLCIDKALQDSENIDILRPTKARLLIAEGHLHGASNILKKLCAERPEQPLYWLDLAAAQRGLRRYIDADKVLRMGLILTSNHHSLTQALIQSLCEDGKLKAAKRLLQQASKEKIVNNDMHLFNIQFLSASYSLISDEQRSTLAKYWGKGRGDENRNLWRNHPITSTSDRKLRIAYLSSDFCDHPVTHFILPILKNHNRRNIETLCINTGNNWDHKTKEVEMHCDQMVNVYGTSDLIAAKIISQLRLDILIELGGYTNKSRLGICLHNPVRHQMSYLGFPGATYLKEIPWWIGDEVLFRNLSSKDKEMHKLVLIQGGYMCLPNPTEGAEVERESHEDFCFGSFNHIRKLTDKTIELWANILKRTPKAKLVIKSISFADKREKKKLLVKFMKHDISEQNIILLDYSKDYKKHLEQYNSVDIALDPIPYGGATTTAEAIWMGVPVLCIHGKGMVGGLSASILTGAEMSEYICKNSFEYIHKAVELYNKGVRNKKKRKDMISKIKSTDFNKPRRITTSLEHVYYRVSQM